MKREKNIPESSSKNTPILDQIEKRNEFLTPKNYFEERINITPSNILKNNFLNLVFDKLSYRIIIPFSGLTIIILIILTTTISPNSKQATISEIEDVLNADSYSYLDEDLLIDSYAETLKTTPNSNKKTVEYSSEYIDYLIENDIDINVIINEL